MAIFLGYYFTHSYVQIQIKRCIYKSDSGESTQKPREVNPSTSQPNPTDPEGKNLDEGPAQVQYSKYPLPIARSGDWFNNLQRRLTHNSEVLLT